MTPEFDDWWDRDDLITEGNPYVDGTPAYWAWEGWCAGVEACAKVCDEHNARQNLFAEERYAAHWLARAIRARGNT
jgi:hypothetical protein